MVAKEWRCPSHRRHRHRCSGPHSPGFYETICADASCLLTARATAVAPAPRCLEVLPPWRRQPRTENATVSASLILAFAIRIMQRRVAQVAQLIRPADRSLPVQQYWSNNRYSGTRSGRNLMYTSIRIT